jgi:hypothetical protein
MKRIIIIMVAYMRDAIRKDAKISMGIKGFAQRFFNIVKFRLAVNWIDIVIYVYLYILILVLLGVVFIFVGWFYSYILIRFIVKIERIKVKIIKM